MYKDDNRVNIAKIVHMTSQIIYQNLYIIRFKKIQIKKVILLNFKNFQKKQFILLLYINVVVKLINFKLFRITYNKM